MTQCSASSRCWYGPERSLKVGEPNPLAVFVDAKFFNGFLDFFRSRLRHWAWEPAPCARLPRDEDGA